MKKILIWGTGNLARRFIENKCGGEIIGFVETVKSRNSFMQKPVYEVRKIPKTYDYIIVANSYVDEILNLCMELDIDLGKVIFLYRTRTYMGCTDASILKEILMERNYTSYCMEFGLSKGTFIDEDVKEYQKLNRRVNFNVHDEYMRPIIVDKYANAGEMGNEFWQDLWAAKLIIESGVKKHFDIGSRLDGFIAHLLAAGIDVTMIDIREFPGEIDHLHTIVDDATSLRQIPDESIGSMSALCSLEHFGLGRYGDPVDPEACFKCFDNIQRKLKKGGEFYLSVPVGRERVEFNAHRVFYASTITECFRKLRLKEFSCTSQGKIEYNADIHKYDNDSHNGEWRYGLFHFIK